MIQRTTTDRAAKQVDNPWNLTTENERAEGENLWKTRREILLSLDVFSFANLLDAMMSSKAS